MVVYIEYALAENFIIDEVLLFVSLKALRQKIKIPLLLLSGGCGAVGAIIFPLLSLPYPALIAVKILLGALMCVIVAPKKLILVCAAFFTCSFALGGGILALFSLPFANKADSATYGVSSLPAGAVIALVISGGAAILFGAKKLYARGKILRSTVECSLTNGKRSVKTLAIEDSGNNLFFKGEPVSIASPAVVARLISDPFNNSPFYSMSVKTVTGEAVIKIIKIQSLTICRGKKEKVISGAYIGVAKNFTVGEYGLILNGSYIE